MLTFAYCFFSTWCWKNTGILWVHPNLVGHMAVFVARFGRPITTRTEIPLLETVGGCPNTVLSKDLNNSSQSKNQNTQLNKKKRPLRVKPIMDKKKCSYGFPGIWTRAIILHLHAHTWAHIHTWVHTGKNIFLCPRLCWQVCACSSYSCYLLCCVLVGMCLAAASWQSKNGLLVTLPPSQPVAGLRVHHLQLLPAVAQLCCLMVEMRMAAASWQSKNCLLRYSRSKLPILIKMCCGGSAGPVRSRPRSRPCSIGIPYCSIPVPDPGPPTYHPWPTPRANGRISHKLLANHPLRVGYGSLYSCYADTIYPMGTSEF